MLLALRLVGQGDIRVGRLFFSRPAIFKIGGGGMQSSGYSLWHSGAPYSLSSAQIPTIRYWYDQLTRLEQNHGKQHRNVQLALRSFSSIYDRLFHQVEDLVLDAITALEVLWKLETELKFRLSFLTAGLLGATDDERQMLFETLSKYYRIRSKIVHGSTLNDNENVLVLHDETLRRIVRQALHAFVHLANNPAE